MLKLIFDAATVKGILILYAILMLLITIGNSIEDEPIKKEPWVKQTNYENKVYQKRTPNYHYNRKQQPWHDDRKEQTENWADFLETLENRGYSIYDPEAEDIWEEFN